MKLGISNEIPDIHRFASNAGMTKLGGWWRYAMTNVGLVLKIRNEWFWLGDKKQNDLRYSGSVAQSDWFSLGDNKAETCTATP